MTRTHKHGTSSSIFNDVATTLVAIDDTDSRRMSFSRLPMLKFLIVDMSLITGMNTSTVGILADIKELYVQNICQLYLCGLSPRIRASLALGGAKPESDMRSERSFRFSHDLDIDSTLGKAEDLLTSDMEEMGDTVHNGGRSRFMGSDGPGDNKFRFALKEIDEQHGQALALLNA